jgi:hypothetical protein
MPQKRGTEHCTSLSFSSWLESSILSPVLSWPWRLVTARQTGTTYDDTFPVKWIDCQTVFGEQRTWRGTPIVPMRRDAPAASVAQHWTIHPAPAGVTSTPLRIFRRRAPLVGSAESRLIIHYDSTDATNESLSFTKRGRRLRLNHRPNSLNFNYGLFTPASCC